MSSGYCYNAYKAPKKKNKEKPKSNSSTKNNDKTKPWTSGYVPKTGDTGHWYNH